MVLPVILFCCQPVYSSWIIFPLLFIYFVCIYLVCEARTQGVLYHLNHSPNSFCLFFQIGSYAFCPGQTWSTILLPMPRTGRIRDMNPHIRPGFFLFLLLNCFAQTVFKQWSSYLHQPDNWDLFLLTFYQFFFASHNLFFTLLLEWWFYISFRVKIKRAE
jgi:hypothetical protein